MKELWSGEGDKRDVTDDLKKEKRLVKIRSFNNTLLESKRLRKKVKEN